MHEFSVAESILDVVEQQVGRGTRLNEVHLTVGPLSGVAVDALRFCFTEVARQRGMGEPVLEVTEPPAEVVCRACGMTYEASDFYAGCPFCSSFDREIVSGRECSVDWVTTGEDGDG